MTETPPPTLAENLLSLIRTVEHLTAEHTIRTRQFYPPVHRKVVDMVEGVPVVNMLVSPARWGTATVAHRPLIEQLRDAIYESTSAGAGAAGVTEARARSVVNAAALAQLTDLRAAIGAAWTNLMPGMELPASWSEEHALRTWADLFVPKANAGQVDEADVADAAAAFGAWRRAIEEMHTPREVMTSNSLCPSCLHAWTLVDDLRVRPIQVMIARNPEHHRAVCRNPNCGHEWVGEEALRILAKDQRDLITLGVKGKDYDDPDDSPEEGTLDTELLDSSH